MCIKKAPLKNDKDVSIINDSKIFLDWIGNKRINFLIGSGTSASLIPTLSVLENRTSLTALLESDLEQRNKNILMLFYYYHWVNKASKNNLKKDPIKFDQLLTTYRIFLESIIEFADKQRLTHPKRINIFTTNYDPFFELAFDEVIRKKSFCFMNDGGRGFSKRYFSIKNFYLIVSHSGYFDNYKTEIPTINLFKVHGSVTWDAENNLIRIVDETDPKTILEISNRLSVFDDRTYQSIHSIFFDREIKEKDLVQYVNEELNGLLLDEIKVKQCLDGLKSLPIILPSDWKFGQTVLEQNYYQLLRALSYELEAKQSVLITLGFSFSDPHINEIIQRSSLNPELLPIIVTYKSQDRERIKEKFSDIKSINYLPSNEADVRGDMDYLTSLFKGGKLE